MNAVTVQLLKPELAVSLEDNGKTHLHKICTITELGAKKKGLLNQM